MDSETMKDSRLFYFVVSLPWYKIMAELAFVCLPLMYQTFIRSIQKRTSGIVRGR